MLGLRAHRHSCRSRTITVDDMATDPASAPLRSTRRVTIEELAVAQGVKPMEATEEWAADIFESDEELDAFLAELQSWRASGR
jgi:hypothetical protein